MAHAQITILYFNTINGVTAEEPFKRVHRLLEVESGQGYDLLLCAMRAPRLRGRGL